MSVKCETEQSEKTGSGQPEQNNKAPETGKKSHAKVWIIIGVAVLAVVIAAILIVNTIEKSFLGTIDELHEVPELEDTFFDAVKTAASLDYDKFLTFFHPAIENVDASTDLKDAMKGRQEDFQDAELKVKGLQVESVTFRDDENSCRKLHDEILEKFGADIHITNTSVIRFTVSYETNHDIGKEEIAVPFMEADGKWYIDPNWRAN